MPDPTPPKDDPESAYKAATEWIERGMTEPPPPAPEATPATAPPESDPPKSPSEDEVDKVLKLDEERRRRHEGLHTKSRAKRQAASGTAAGGGEFVNLSDKTHRPLPPDCPVICLGTQNENYYFIDTIGQFIVKKVAELTQVGVDGLFKGDEANRWIEQHYGRYARVTREGGHRFLLGIERDLLRRALIAKCGEMGIFDPTDRLRGVGAWRGPHGELIWHLGDVIWRQDRRGIVAPLSPGMIDGIVYPLGDTQRRPADDEAAVCSERGQDGTWDGPAGDMLNLLKRWHWKRGELDARLYLGCLTAAMVGGALLWRPNSYIIGPYQSGKTELQAVALAFMGGAGSAIHSADATSAGVRQILKGRSLPVELDEVEPGTDNTRRQSIIELARVSASGGKFTRGGSGHEAVEFTVRSIFFFTSILPLPMAPQDLSRLVMLELGRIPRGVAGLGWDKERVEAWGAAVRRRLVTLWPRFEPEYLAPFREHLSGEVGGRSADVFGTGFAMQHLALFDEPPSPAEVEALCAPVIEGLKALKETEGEEHDQALAHLLSAQIEIGEKRQHHSVLSAILLSASLNAATLQTLVREGVTVPDLAPAAAKMALNAHGMNVVGRRGEGRWLALAIQGAAVDRLYRGTRWQSGVWFKALSRIPNADPDGRRRIDGPIRRCLLLPMAAIIGELDDSQVEEAPDPNMIEE